MNEQFKEIAIKAKVHHCISHVRLQEFAELIVRECAELVRIQNEQFMTNESHYGVVSTDILKHFGVKHD
jgi:hypothetical protein